MSERQSWARLFGPEEVRRLRGEGQAAPDARFYSPADFDRSARRDLTICSLRWRE